MKSDKLVFITGCTRGLGRAMIPEFIDRGWCVAGCARDPEMIAALQSEFGAPHWFGVWDLADAAAVASLCKQFVAEAGLPHLVLNNAAIVNASAPIWQVPEEEFSRVIDINIKGPASVMRALLPAMLERGSGVIVNFSSGWGRSTSPEVAPYCATKFAIEGLSMAAAQETKGKVAIIPLNPGIIDTRMLRSCFGGEAAHYPGPEEWARTAVPFLIELGPKDNGRPLTAPGG